MIKDDYFLSLLFEIAKNVPKVAGARIAAALVYHGKIIAQGQNRYKSHPLQKEWGKNEKAIFLHAELDAAKRIYQERLDFSDYTIYIARAKRMGNVWIPGNARPCVGCMGFLSDELRLKRIVYT